MKPRGRFTDGGGLYLEVRNTGAKLWFWKHRVVGKEKRLAIGAYPAVTLAQARRARDQARLLLGEGGDPVQAKRDARVAERLRQATDFESVARAWHANWAAARSSRHAGYVLRRLEADVFPTIGSSPVADITAPRLLIIAKRIEQRGASDLARRCWQTCGQVFEYALAHGLVERNPAKDVRPGAALKARKAGHFARLDLKEVPELLRKIEAYPGSVHTRLALKLMALTFVRTSELIGARWEEFDLKAAEWRIPATRMKLPTPHIVPLSRQAVDVLRSLQEIPSRSGLVFPGERDHEKPMSNNTLLGALKRMGYAGRMTGHGFRGIASTALHEQGFDHTHIELQLAHMDRDEVSAAYNFATYLPQRRRMLQWWANRLDSLRQSLGH